MSRYTVIWPSDLKAELAERWVESDSAGRERLTRLNDLIDTELALNANQRGRPVRDEPGVRSWTVSGARVVFEVSPDDRTVRVLLVRFLRGG